MIIKGFFAANLFILTYTYSKHPFANVYIMCMSSAAKLQQETRSGKLRKNTNNNYYYTVITGI